MLICEAAGFDRILIETVGVGQSEVAVSDLVDVMLLVLPPVGGDDLQLIKRGIMEVADCVLVNKADGPTEGAAKRAVAEVKGCLHMLSHRYGGWGGGQGREENVYLLLCKFWLGKEGAVVDGGKLD